MDATAQRIAWPQEPPQCPTRGCKRPATIHWDKRRKRFYWMCDNCALSGRTARVVNHATVAELRRVRETLRNVLPGTSEHIALKRRERELMDASSGRMWVRTSEHYAEA